MTKKFTISNSVSGTELGIYEGNTEAEALDAMARDAGYSDHEHACEATGGDGSDLIVREVE